VEARVAYSVTALNQLVRELLDTSLPPVWVAGEIANWKRSARGHCYFSLRDAHAQVRCVLFAADARRLPAEPEEGMRVRALGTVTLYEARGEYQLIVRELEASDAGGLWRLAFERLRARLEAEGLLDPARKRALPRSPRRVGVVTSAAGRRHPRHPPGHRAARSVDDRGDEPGPGAGRWGGARDRAGDRASRRARGRGRDHRGPGGRVGRGPRAFNREEVARAIAACPVPVVSAVGHEVDVTIADLVADHRAATPSAAAERVVLDGTELRRHLRIAAMRLNAGAARLTDGRRRDVDELALALRGRTTAWWIAGESPGRAWRTSWTPVAAGRAEARVCRRPGRAGQGAAPGRGFPSWRPVPTAGRGRPRELSNGRDRIRWLRPETSGVGDRLEKLESIVDRLDTEDLELQEALDLFEEGVAHVREAYTPFEHARLRVETLVVDGRGGQPASAAPAG
jgi:exodeoxyribonuclease VII small subunit